MAEVADLDSKLELLMSMAADDREGAPSSGPPRAVPPRLRHAKQAGTLRPLNLRLVRPGGHGPRVPLMRILMTNACSFNCHYCPMRRDRTLPRTLLKPEELARIFLEAYRRRWCDGLFVTTGIPGRPVRVADDLVRVLELLRVRHGFRGYVHVKLVPGAEEAQIDRITALASRVSINLEAPCGASLARIAPEKSFPTALAALERIRGHVLRSRAEAMDGRPCDPLRPGGVAGITTQFVVGATGDSDREILARVGELYARGGAHHTHFSAFRPIRDTPMEHMPAAPALREHRLYEADHLLRRYGFAPGEIVYDAEGNLPLGVDPKAAWALAHPERFPVEVRVASEAELVRVPGIGPETARRIVAARRHTVFRGLSDLRRIGVVTARAAGFLTLGGRRLQAVRWAEQLPLWEAAAEVGSYRRVYEVSPGTFR